MRSLAQGVPAVTLARNWPAGEDVVFIARGRHLQAIRTQGLRVETSKGEIVIQLRREVGVATPLHEFIDHSLLPLELGARGKVQFPA